MAFEDIPAELRHLPRWACWQERDAGDGKRPDKPPIQANVPFDGKHVFAKANDPETWATFEVAKRYWNNHLKDGGRPSGLSFALNGDGIVGIDLDNCRDDDSKVIAPWASEMIERLSSYTEISPSRTGIRIFVRGQLPAGGRHKGNREVYGANKFLTVTGSRITKPGAARAGVEDRTAELRDWHREEFGAAAAATKKKAGAGLVVNDPPQLDEALLKRLFRVKPQAKKVFEGQHVFPSHSEVDLALANYTVAAGWTPQQTCDLLVAARLNVDEQVKPVAYFERTIDKAQAGRTGKLSPKSGGVLAESLPNEDGALSNEADGPEVGCMADVAELIRGVDYLVPEWIPYGMLTMVMGEPGVGKSAFALYALARPVITGSNWFNGHDGPAEPADVLWCDCEGTAAISTQRIKDWSLPADRIKVPFKDDPLRAISLRDDEHVNRIEAIIEKYRIRLVVIDSLRGAHDGDENSSSVVSVTKKLAKVAERTNSAIVIIHHARKQFEDEEMTANSSRGSNAIVATVRSQLGINRPDPQSDWCRLQMLKENLGLKPEPIGVRVTATGVEFGPPPKRVKRESVKDLAMQFLRSSMEPGKKYKAATLIEAAAEHGISESALLRARAGLGVLAKKVKDGWELTLPKR